MWNPFTYFYDRFFVVRRDIQNDPYHFLKGDGYEPFDADMKSIVDKQLAKPCEDVYVTSYDGLKLHARYYERNPEAPTFLLFHGYRTHPFRDNAGLIAYCEEQNMNYLLCDHRGQGTSEGDCTTYGNQERFDVKTWCQWAVNRLGEDSVLYLGGASMGATSVLLSTELGLPENVKAVVADCGFSSPDEIIVKVGKSLGFPAWFSHAVMKFIAKKYVGFDLDEVNTKIAMLSNTIPTLFIHGTGDNFVPMEMSRRAYESCVHLKPLQKDFLEIENAPHMMAYFYDPELYLSAVHVFLMVNAPEQAVDTTVKS